MNNASLFFPFEDGDDLMDLYEERLFEDKQFFTSRTILSAIFEKRLTKMEKREQAFCYLTKTEIPISNESARKWEESDNIPDAYRMFQKHKTKIFKEIYQSSNVSSISFWVEQLLFVHNKYAEQLALPDMPIEENILLSKEPEPTSLAKVIEAFEAAGGQLVSDIEKLTFEGQEILLAESKRLSLWRQKENINGDLR